MFIRPCKRKLDGKLLYAKELVLTECCMTSWSARLTAQSYVLALHVLQTELRGRPVEQLLLRVVLHYGKELVVSYDADRVVQQTVAILVELHHSCYPCVQNGLVQIYDAKKL